VTFSSCYVLRKDPNEKREGERMSLLGQIAAQRKGGLGNLYADGNSSSDNPGSEFESADSARSSGSEGSSRKPDKDGFDSTILEARSEDERSSGSSSSCASHDKSWGEEKEKKIPKPRKTVGIDTGKKKGRSQKLQKKYGANSFWG
jgi:hypothetical protein